MDRRALSLCISLLAGFGCDSYLAAREPHSQFATESAVTRSGQGFTRDRDEGDLRNSSDFIESRTNHDVKQRGSIKDSSSTTLSSLALEAWIYDAGTELISDFDGDGYYHYLRVRFDADSIFSDHWMFARLFVSGDGSFWDEYHVTEDFLIHGTSPFDDFEVETELVSGFPTGLYDILIELYDADTGIFLAEFGPADSSAFSLLPLEDTGFDNVAPVATVSAEHGGGGSLDWIVTTLLALLLIAKRAKNTRPLRALQRTIISRRLVLHSTDKTPSAPAHRSEDCR